MAKPSAFLQRLEAQRRHDMELQRLFTIQQCEDMMLITLGQDFGFGPKRAMEALEAFRETFRAFAQLCVEDAGGDQEIAYTKESIETIRVIKDLVKVRGLKIAAAREVLKQNKEGVPRPLEALQRLRAIRSELVAMRDALGAM